jgi:hypothetical protein
MKRFTIDLHEVRTFEDFIAAFDLGFVKQPGSAWNGSLDAFNDYLRWPEPQEYELELLGTADCAVHLGHAAMAAWLRDTLRTCHPSGIAGIQARLVRAEAGDGETLFELILRIVTNHPGVHLLRR